MNGGTLTVSSCEIYGNNEADISTHAELNITDSASERKLYNADTGEQISLPLSAYSETAAFIYLTDEEAAERFPTAVTTPDPEPEPEPEPTPEPTPEPEPKPSPEPGTDNDEYTPSSVINRPSCPVISMPNPVPDPTPALACGDAIIDLSSSVVLQGYPDGKLHLEDNLTRAQMATIIFRLLDAKTIEKYATTRSAFDDVPADMWCCEYVSTIANADIVWYW